LSKQVVAFAGLDPLEKSSAGKVKFGGSSKQNNWPLRFFCWDKPHTWLHVTTVAAKALQKVG
jgi:hypothetical protein